MEKVKVTLWEDLKDGFSKMAALVVVMSLFLFVLDRGLSRDIPDDLERRNPYLGTEWEETWQWSSQDF